MALKQSERLRRIGLAILVIGLIAAAVFYVLESRGPEPTAANFFPNAERDTDREIGVMMGTFGVMMLGWSRALALPGTQALLIAGGGAFASFICFRIAAVWEHNDRVRGESR